MSSSASDRAQHPPPGTDAPPRGLARLAQCGNPRAAFLGRWITDLASRCDAGTQDKIQSTLSHLGWMLDHGVDYGGVDALENLERLQRLLSQADKVPLAMLQGIDEAMVEHVRRVLTQARREAQGPPYDLMANAWSLALAKMLLLPDGRFDVTVFSSVQKLVGSADLSWLPVEHGGDFLAQIQAFMKEPELGPTMDRLSNPQSPPAAAFQAVLARRHFPGERDPRRVLALHLLQTLLTAPLQEGVGYCWHVSKNRQIHFRPLKLLGYLEAFQCTGALPFRDKSGKTVGVPPDPYPAQVMEWATDHVSQERFEELLPQLVEALQASFPQARSDAYWADSLRKHCGAAHAPLGGKGIHIRSVLERVVAAQVKLPALYLDPATLPKSPKWADRLARQQAALAQCLLNWEAQHVNPLATAWQSTVSRHMLNTMLMARCWLPIERALRQSMAQGAKGGLPAEFDRQMARLRQTFMSCASLHLDHLDDPDTTVFRVHLRPTGVTPEEGRGMPIRSVDELVVWLEYVAAQALKGQDDLDTDMAGAWMSQLSAALQGKPFRSAVERANEPDPKRPSTEPTAAWLLNPGTSVYRGDLDSVPKRDLRPDHVHGKRLAKHSFGFSVGPEEYRVSNLHSRGRGHRARKSLVRLIGQWQALNQGMFPRFSLQQHLEFNHGVPVSALSRSGSGTSSPGRRSTRRWSTHGRRPRRRISGSVPAWRNPCSNCSGSGSARTRRPRG